MAKLTLTTIARPVPTQDEYNANSALIEVALENTLSRDGTTPNQMGAEIDMNSFDINNVNKLSTTTLILNGELVVPATGLLVLDASSIPFTPTNPAGPLTTVQDALDDDYLRNDRNETVTGTLFTAGNFVLDIDQTVGAGQDNFVLTYDDGTGEISLETTAAGDVTKVGTPEDNQIGVWTGDGTIEGGTGLTYSGTLLDIAGRVDIKNDGLASVLLDLESDLGVSTATLTITGPNADDATSPFTLATNNTHPLVFSIPELRMGSNIIDFSGGKLKGTSSALTYDALGAFGQVVIEGSGGVAGSIFGNSTAAPKQFGLLDASGNFRVRVKDLLGVELLHVSTVRLETTTTGIDITGNLAISGDVGFYGTSPAVKPTITGSRAGNAALADLLTELQTLGLITDSSS